MTAALALVIVMLMLLGPVGSLLSGRAQARTAADAAALAGAAEGEERARAVAERNGADMVDYEFDGDEVTVEVQVEGVSAHSRARQVPVTTLPSSPAGVPAVPGAGGSGARAGLAPAMLQALSQADALLGQPVPITSGFRSPQRQAELWAQRHTNPYPVAPPGSSMHERGLAVDVPSHFVDRLLTVAGESGLCQTLPVSDPIHFELCNAR